MKEKRAIGEATGILVILVVLLLASLVWLPGLAVLWAGAVLFTLYFFRDPVREAPDDVGVALAPADGKVVGIDNVIEDEIMRRRMLRVSIFLSIFDVHVNRAPIAGRVMYSEGRKGRYLDARDPRSSKENAARMWVIEGKRETVGVRQITGAIARRIVPWSVVGDELSKGEKFGMIRFGSRTELWLPEESQVLVKVGESVRAGETVIARLPPA